MLMPPSLLLLITAFTIQADNGQSQDVCSKCTCRRKHKIQEVDCTGKGLTKIPRCPNGKEALILDDNNLNITNLSAKTLRVLPHSIKKLSFNNCTISGIGDSHLFKYLPNIRVFSIGVNTLNKDSFDNLFNSVRKANLQSLNVSGNNLDEFTEELNFSKLYKLETLMMNSCGLESFEPILETNTTRHFKNLEFVGNFLDGTSLETLRKYGSHYKKLEMLKLSSNLIKNMSQDTFMTLPVLRRLWLDHFMNNATVIFRGIKSSSLRYLDLSYSYDFIKPDVFEFLPNISTLNLSGNDLSKLSDVELKQLLLPMNKLEALSLSGTSLGLLPCTVFKERVLPKLRALDLSLNRIQTWNSTCFINSSTRLKKLYLDRNDITVIDKESFPIKFLEQLDKLHLYGNKFSCNCSIHWFRHWMKKNYNKLDALGKQFKYECSSPPERNNTLLIQYDPYYEECHSPTNTIILALAIVLVLFTMVGILYATRQIHSSRKNKYQKLLGKCPEKVKN